MLFATLLVVGAVAFCAGEPDEPRCTDAPVEAVSLSEAHMATIERLSDQARLGVAYSRERGVADEWRVAQRGDCEDALLWAAAELRRAHPELTNAYRFVAVEQGVEYLGARRVRRTHLVLVIEGEGGRVVIDTQHSRPRQWGDYANQRSYTAPAGLGQAWAPYR